MTIRRVGAELFCADGMRNGRTDSQTATTNLIVAFHYFSKAPKIVKMEQVSHPLHTFIK